jgi:hypothetical protein
MKRMAVALFQLAKSAIARPVTLPRENANNLHWTKFDKPLEQMTQEERRAAAEKIADGMINQIKKGDK